jgi:hypothetical protein
VVENKHVLKVRGLGFVAYEHRRLHGRLVACFLKYISALGVNELATAFNTRFLALVGLGTEGREDLAGLGQKTDHIEGWLGSLIQQ